MYIMSTNFVKTLAWKHDYDVELWRHEYKWPPYATEWKPPTRKFSAYATEQVNHKKYTFVSYEITREMMNN